MRMEKAIMAIIDAKLEEEIVLFQTVPNIHHW